MGIRTYVKRTLTVFSNDTRNHQLTHGTGATSLCSLFSSFTVSKITKEIMYKTVHRPVITEIWVLTKRDENTATHGKKILRRIDWVVNENWNENGQHKSSNKLYKSTPIVAEMKKSRLRWLGHVQRMPGNRTLRKFYGTKPIQRSTMQTMGGLRREKLARTWRSRLVQEI